MSLRKKDQQVQPKVRSNTAPITHILVPSKHQPGSSTPLFPWLYSAILGNGHFLACLDETGSIAQLFYPYVDAGPHVRALLMGIQIMKIDQPGNTALQSDSSGTQKPPNTANEEIDASGDEDAVSWLAGEDWTHELRYVNGSAVIHCISRNAAAGVQIEQTMVAHPELDLLMIDIKMTNLNDTPVICKFVTYAGLNIDQRQSSNTGFFDSETSMLTFFSLDRYISITSDAPVDAFACEKNSDGEIDYLFQEVSAGRFTNREYAIGKVNGAVRFDFGQIEAKGTDVHRINICFGRSLEDVAALSSSIAETKPGIEEVTNWWRTNYANTQPGLILTSVKDVYERSLITIRLLTDRTGGIIAAPECDPDFNSCGGYGFCWPRDGAFIGYALDRVGQHAQARLFYEWALRVQSASGVWYQRYYVQGELAPSWGLVQFDETGIVVWAICRHVLSTEDTSYGQIVFPQLVRACEYMQTALDSETGLAPTTKDLWEERDGISTYACASTWAGFHELSALAARLGNVVEAQRWASAATLLKEAIETHLWDASHGRFLRGIKTKIYHQDVERLNQQPGFSALDILEVKKAGKTYYLYQRDATIDASILSLSVPFGVFSPDDPRILATAESVAKHLTSPVGGIRRYQYDHYRGGNPWVICTLWLALQDLAVGRNERAFDLYNWVLEHRTSLDLLPEQVDLSTGKPCWVVPLAWSHAMFLLVTQELVEHKLL